MSKKIRLKELDILRAIAFIFVVEQHTMGGYYNIDGIGPIYYQIFKIFYTMAKPAVSAFLCISAISLCYVNSESFDCKKYYIKRFFNILVPYVVWCTIYIYRDGSYKGISDFFLQVFSGDAKYHLWYMGMIIRLFIYFPILLWIGKKIHDKSLIKRIIFFVIFVFIYYPLFKYQDIISKWVINFLFDNPSKLQSKIINVTPLFWMLYFIIGMYIALNYKTFKKKILKFKIPVIFIYFGLFIYSYLNEIKVVQFDKGVYLVYYVFTILFWYIVSVKLAQYVNTYKVFNFISKYSFGGYLCHIMIVNYVFNFITLDLGITDWLARGFGVWIGTSVSAALLIKLISYIPYSKFITGAKTSKIVVISNYKTFNHK